MERPNLKTLCVVALVAVAACGGSSDLSPVSDVNDTADLSSPEDAAPDALEDTARPDALEDTAQPDALEDTAQPEVTDVNVDCREGEHRCEGVCVSNDNVATCGDRCSPCTTDRDNATATCADGVCGFECDEGFFECNGRCLASETPFCGETCTVCPQLTNGTWTCTWLDACLANCDAGFIGHTCGVPTLSDTWNRTNTATNFVAARTLADGTIAVAVRAPTPGIDIYTRAPTAATFELSRTLAVTVSPASVAISASGDVVVAESNSLSNPTVYVLHDTEGGSEILDVPRINGQAVVQTGSMLFSADGNLHLFVRTLNSAWHYTVRTADGTWSTPSAMDASIGQAEISDVWRTTDGTFHLLHLKGNSVWLQTLAPSGQITTTEVSSGRQSWFGRLVTDASGSIHVLYAQVATTSNDALDVLYRTRADGQWSTPVVIATSPGLFPWRMVITRSGMPQAVLGGWQNAPNPSDARFAELTADGWRVTPIRANLPDDAVGDVVRQAEMVLDANDAPVIFTRQNIGGTTRVFDAK